MKKINKFLKDTTEIVQIMTLILFDYNCFEISILGDSIWKKKSLIKKSMLNSGRKAI